MTNGARSQSGLRACVVIVAAPPNLVESAKMSMLTRLTLPSTPAAEVQRDALSFSSVAQR